MAIFAMGIMPYITASIIMQLLTMVSKRLEALMKEGPAGQKKVNQYTRYFTAVLALIEAIGFVFLFDNQYGAFATDGAGTGLHASSLVVLTLTVGAVMVMWLGELVTQRGIGNGISLMIFASIVSRLPDGLRKLFTLNPGIWVAMAVIAVLVVVFIVLVTQGQRRIPVQYAKRVVGRKVYGGQSTYLPLRVNMAGRHPGDLRLVGAAVPGHPGADGPVGLDAVAGQGVRTQLLVVHRGRGHPDHRSSPTSTRRCSSTPSTRPTTSRSTAASSPASARDGRRRPISTGCSPASRFPGALFLAAIVLLPTALYKGHERALLLRGHVAS